MPSPKPQGQARSSGLGSDGITFLKDLVRQDPLRPLRLARLGGALSGDCEWLARQAILTLLCPQRGAGGRCVSPRALGPDCGRRPPSPQGGGGVLPYHPVPMITRHWA
jgi:hypothetical protein